MLHDNMDLCRLMVHTQHVEDSRRRNRGHEGKNHTLFDQAGSSTSRSQFRVEDRPKFKKGNEHSGYPTLSMNNNANWDKSIPKKGNNRNAQCDRESCGKCGRWHGGEFLVGSNVCYGYRKSRHVINGFPRVNNQAKADTQPRPNPTGVAEPPKRNMFYALKGTQEQAKSVDVATGNLLVYSFPMYALLDP